MGEKILFQPLTKSDQITVLLYRSGIIISTLVLGAAGLNAFLRLYVSQYAAGFISGGLVPALMLYVLYFSVGLSVFFIHLYIGKLYRFLKRIYYLAGLCLIVLLIAGHGNPVALLLSPSPYFLLLLPVAGCLGFVTAKEAFCFRLYEGYLLFGLMPAYLLFSASGMLDQRGMQFGLLVISALLVIFTLRKVFMPLHFDIGDKSAYMP